MRQVAAVLALSLVVSACGSTVQSDGAIRRAPASEDMALPWMPEGGDVGAGPGGADRDIAAEDGRGGAAEAGGSEPSRDGPHGGGRSGALTAGSSEGPATTAGGAATGPGFTADEIFIGLAFDSTFSEQAAAVGVSPSRGTIGDPRAIANAIAEDINDRGGIAGRQIVMVYYDVRGQSDWSVAAQAACTRWTQDQRVFAAMSWVSQINNDVLYSCLAQNEVAFAPVSTWKLPRSILARYAPYLWLITGAEVERVAPIWMQRLAVLDYFDGWDTTLGQPGDAPAKIGLIYNVQEPGGVEVAQAVERALAQQGRSVEAKAEYTEDNASRDVSQAVLRFRSAGVTHVIGDGSLILFTPAAESQHYRPRYGLATLSLPTLITLLAPRGQLRGALGIGWAPPMDVESGQDPGDVSPAAAHCREVMERSGQPPATRIAWAAMSATCDGFSFFVTTIAHGGLSAAGVVQGARTMGSMPSAATFRLAFPNGRADGPSVARDLGYRDDCGCLAYMSDQNHDL